MNLHKHLLVLLLPLAFLVVGSQAQAQDQVSDLQSIIAVQQSQIAEQQEMITILRQMLTYQGSPIINAEGVWQGPKVNLKGDKGDKGATGAKGAQGARGPKGSAGARGPQGPRGDAYLILKRGGHGKSCNTKCNETGGRICLAAKVSDSSHACDWAPSGPLDCICL